MIKQHFLINCYQKGIQIWLAICYQIALYVNHRKVWYGRFVSAAPYFSACWCTAAHQWYFGRYKAQKTAPTPCKI